MLKTLLTLSTLVVAGKIVSDTLKKEGEKFWQKMKFAVDPSSIKVKSKLVNTNVRANLTVDNNYHQNLTAKDLFVQILFKNKNGDLVELARTEPSSKIFPIAAKKRTVINDVSIDISNLSALKAIPILLNKPQGERFKVVINGVVNGFPFSTETWY